MTTILLADDDPTVLAVLREMLEAPGRTLVVAEEPEDALRQAADIGDLALAVVDKNMPQMSGIDLVRRLKELHPDAEYVMLTAYPSVESAAEAVRLGLFDYVSKPFDLDALDAVIGRALDKVRARRDDAALRQEVELRLAHFTANDPLTGLPNRGSFVHSVDRALSQARNDPGRGFAVLVLDLNDFGRINDSVGHEAGDDVLVQWAGRLMRMIRAGDVVARLGSDQLTVLAGHIRGPEEAVELTRRLQASLLQPFHVAGERVVLTASAGIAVSSLGYERGEDLLRDAGTALVQAKAIGKGAYAVFVSGMRNQAVDLFALDQELRRAVERREFVPYYQPIVAIESRRVVAFESLARWERPDGVLARPDQFLPRATEIGLLEEISWQVLCKACEQQRRWIDDHGEALRMIMSVNVAPPLLMRSGFSEQVRDLIHDLGLSPLDLKLEVTEVVALYNTAASAEVIQELRKLGVVVCLDDFGTGFASLAWLHQFPVDELKIDRSFVARIADDRRSQILVGAAVGLAHSLGLPVVAEGVEHESQLAELAAIACEYAQGFLFAPPLSTADAEALLRSEMAAR